MVDAPDGSSIAAVAGTPHVRVGPDPALVGDDHEGRPAALLGVGPVRTKDRSERHGLAAGTGLQI
jgi:hypothetical protein